MANVKQKAKKPERYPSSVILPPRRKAPKCPVIALTMGDPGGVGPEIIVKTLRKEKKDRSCAYLVIGASEAFEFLRKQCKLSVPFHEIEESGLKSVQCGQVYFLDISRGSLSEPKSWVGKLTRGNGALALAILEKAASLAQRGLVEAIVTAPVNKAAIRLADKHFIGHTEFFALRARAKRFAMMFSSPKLKVTLATIHVPLKKVSSLLTTRTILEKILLTHQALRDGFGISRPRLAVCALNPHGREAGDEEDTIIAPAVRRARQKGVNASGPFSADQLFYAAYHGKYDALISMYHDQALGPFKMIAFHEGVNLTLGLPYVRTSPDHGTAFDIAYRGKANPSSMREALRLARNLVLSRHANAD